MRNLEKINKSFCISSSNPENSFDYSLDTVDQSLISSTELKKFFSDSPLPIQDKTRLISHYRIWKRLSTSKIDQFYFVFEGESPMSKGFCTLWNSFLSKLLPENFSICLMGDHDPNKLNELEKYSENDSFYRISKSAPERSLESSCYIISKSAANLVCQYINNKGFNLKLDNFLFNFFVKNDFFSNPESIIMLKSPQRLKTINNNNFFYNEDVLFEKRKTFIDMKREWMSITGKEDFSTWLKLKPRLPTISSYPPPPKEIFSCYNPGQRIAIATLYTPDIYSYAYQSEISIKNFCFKHGYTLYVYRDSIDKDSFPSWSKPDVLLNHISDHEIISWFDSDTIIFNPDRKLEWIVDNTTRYKEFIFSEDIGNHNYINSGVFFCRNVPHAKNILEKWRDFKLNNNTSSLYAEGGDQKVLGDIVKKIDVYKFFHKVFPMSDFNTDPRLINWDTFVIHFMAYPRHLKDYFMNFWNFGFPIYK